MPDDFQQITWDEQLEDDCRQVIRLAVREDLDRGLDWTTVAIVLHETPGKAEVVDRQAGVIAGLPAARTVLEEMAPSLAWQPQVEDGASITSGQTVAAIKGPARHILTCERIVLNFLSRLSGVATLTAKYVEAISGTKAKIYDTRKTTPGWRRLEKYAVRCGGGHNHRTGLFDAVLIKDNHIALWEFNESQPSLAAAIERVRDVLQKAEADKPSTQLPQIIEFEVDSLAQLEAVLPAMPNIVLLDNMPPDVLRDAISLRDRLAPDVELEASGGVRLETIADIAATGVDRISAGALTHSAISLDFGLDWDPR